MNKIIVIVGPTGVGKTKLSIMLAKIYNAEIINADSMQIYKGLDIGTAKVTKSLMADIKHHLLDIKEVTEDYSVFDYQQDCRDTISKVFSKNKNVILVGGTGLYIKASLYDYCFALENTKDNQYEELTTKEIYNKILKINPNMNIDQNNRRRLVRCLNKLEKGIVNKSSSKLLYNNVYFIGLKTERSILYERINKRVDEMIPLLVNEVKPFYEKNIHSKALMTGIGYKELYDYFANKKSFEETIDLIKKNSRHYAKRQLTWFNNQMDIKWFDVNYLDFDKTFNEVTAYLNSR